MKSFIYSFSFYLSVIGEALYLTIAQEEILRKNGNASLVNRCIVQMISLRNIVSLTEKNDLKRSSNCLKGTRSVNENFRRVKSLV